MNKKLIIKLMGEKIVSLNEKLEGMTLLVEKQSSRITKMHNEIADLSGQLNRCRNKLFIVNADLDKLNKIYDQQAEELDEKDRTIRDLEEAALRKGENK